MERVKRVVTGTVTKGGVTRDVIRVELQGDLKRRECELQGDS